MNDTQQELANTLDQHFHKLLKAGGTPMRRRGKPVIGPDGKPMLKPITAAMLKVILMHVKWKQDRQPRGLPSDLIREAMANLTAQPPASEPE